MFVYRAPAWAVLIGFVIVAGGAAVFGRPFGPSGQSFAGLLAVAALGLITASAIPVELTADGSGVHFRRLGRTRTFPWADIESIGVGRVRGFEGYDQPVVRALSGRRPYFPRCWA